MASILEQQAAAKAGATKPTVPVVGVATQIPYDPPVFTGSAVESIIHPDVQHVLLTGGFYGSGKTSLMCSIDNPENILMLDFEAKGDMVAKQLGLTNYFAPTVDTALVHGFDAKPIHNFDRTKQIIQAIPAGRFTTLILDGLLILQDAILAEIQGNGGQNALRYGANPSQISNILSGAMGGPWLYVKQVMNTIFVNARSKGIKVIGITTELKNRWEKQGPVLNSFELKGADIVHKMSVWSTILMPGDPKNGGAPSALVLKEALGLYKPGQPPIKRIPPKMPLATMLELYRYLNEPADYRALRPEEIPSNEEMAPFKKIISKDQLDAMRDLLELARLQQPDSKETTDD